MGRKSEAKAAAAAADQSMVEEDGKASYEEKLKNVSVIAKPMASKKLTKKLYKVIKKGSKQKNQIRNGLKDVQSQIRKGQKGLVVFAGDVTPIEVMCHLPAVCEEKGIPYIYTPSRDPSVLVKTSGLGVEIARNLKKGQDLGTAMGVKRGSLMILIKESEDYKEAFDECKVEMEAQPAPTMQ